MTQAEKLTRSQIDPTYVIAISSETMGRGDDELGKLLLTNFLHTLTGQPRIPHAIVLYNGAVNLIKKGSPHLGDFTLLGSMGTEILACGTCVNFYKMAEEMAVGKTSNMFDITKTMSDSSRLVQIS